MCIAILCERTFNKSFFNRNLPLQPSDVSYLSHQSKQNTLQQRSQHPSLPSTVNLLKVGRPNLGIDQVFSRILNKKAKYPSWWLYFLYIIGWWWFFCLKAKGGTFVERDSWYKRKALTSWKKWKHVKTSWRYFHLNDRCQNQLCSLLNQWKPLLPMCLHSFLHTALYTVFFVYF